MRRLVRRLSRRDSITLPLTLLLIGAASVARELSEQDEKQGNPDESDASARQDAIQAQPGDKIAVLAGSTRIAEHVLTEQEIAAGKVRIAMRSKDRAETLDGQLAEAAPAAQEDAAQPAVNETTAQAAAAEGEAAGAVIMEDSGGSSAGTASPSGDDGSSVAMWVLLGAGAVGVAIAATNDGDDKHAAVPGDEEPPPPPPPPSEISGQVIKGYLQGAAVYLDTDHDGQPDGAPVYTDSAGRFTFTTDQTDAALLVFGGVDTLTHVPLDGMILRAPAGATVVSPLTTLIDEVLKQDATLSVEQAQARVADALGLSLPAGIDLLKFDPLEHLQNGGAEVEDLSESVLNTISAVQSLLVATGATDAASAANAAIAAIVRVILEDSDGLDLTSSADVAQVLQSAFADYGVGTSSDSDFGLLAGAIAAVNGSLMSASGLGDAALQATRYALTGFQDILTNVGVSASASGAYERDISFSHNGDLVAAIEELVSGNIADAIERNSGANISYAQRLEGERFVFALNPELKLYQGAPDQIDTVTLKFDVAGVVVERATRTANGTISHETVTPGKDGTYTLQYAELDKIWIKPPENFNGVLGAAISVHYVGLGVVESDTLGIAITPVNDAPTSEDFSVSVAEDNSHVFSVEEFPFSDALDEMYAGGGNALGAVKIVSLPEAGTLYLGEKAITAQDIADGLYISAEDIAAGLFRFVPAADAHGEGYASFQFQVRDDGGTAHGGRDLDPSVHTATIDVASVNDEPVAGDVTVTIDEDEPHTFALDDFDFTDLEGNDLAAVIVASLPEGGALWHGDHRITQDDLGESGYPIPVADLVAGKFKFVPDADKNGSIQFEFRLQDDGGTDHGGKDTSDTATFTFDVTPVSDAPVAGDGSATVPEAGQHIFTVADFPFTDVDEDELANLIIDSLPSGGTLYFDGAALTEGDLGESGYVVSAKDLADGKLVFVPGDASAGTVDFNFRLQDGGSLDNGGENTSAQATFTLTLTPPLGAPTGVSLIESDNATEKGDGNTNQSSLTFRVDLPEAGAYEGVVVQLFARGTDEPVATYTLSAEDVAQGWASVQLTTDLGEGTHAISARLADASDTVHTDLTAPFYTVVDRTPPAAPVLDFTSITVREDDAESFVVSGSAEAFATVEVTLAAGGHDAVVYRATAAADGRFHVAVDPTQFGSETTISITAVAVDRAENASFSDTATVTIVDAVPPANQVTGTDDDEIIAGVSGDAVVFAPGANGGNDYFIGSATAFDTVRIDGNAADYTFTLVEGDARATEEETLQRLGHALLEDEPLYLVRSWTGDDWLEVRVQADAIQFDDAVVRLTKDGVVASGDSGVTLHDEAGDERITGGAGGDTLFSHDGDDWLDGGSGNDTLLTVAGHDTLVGGDGDDTLVVLGDTLSAGNGNEVELHGGSGSDVFMIAPQTGFDRDVTVHDFVIGEDKIDLSWLRILDGDTARELTIEDLGLEQLNAGLHENAEMQIDLGQFVTSDTHAPVGGILTVVLAGGASTLTDSDFILAASESSLSGQALMWQAYLETA